ncbi:MAG TPA: ATP-binding protein [Ktedonobacterales bacterium]|nr:ATP-binding protein [Ktedonobacterales bacterium]
MRNIVRQKVSLQLLSLYLLFIIPVLLGGTGLYVFQRNTLEQNAFQSDQGLSQAVALEIGAYVQSASELDQELATSQAATSLDPQQLNALFSSAFGAYPDISLYSILDPTGKGIFDYPSNQITIGHDFGYTDYFLGAIHNSAPYVSSRRISATTLTSVFTVATTMRNQSGRLVGVMAIDVSLDFFNLHLQAIQRQLSPTSEVGIWIIDRRGQAVATTKTDPTSQNLPDLPLEVASFAQGNTSGKLTAHQQSRDWLYSLAPIPEANWSVVVQRPADVTFAIVTEFERGLIVALLLFIIGATFFWFMVRWRLIAPLTRLASAVSLIQPEGPGLGKSASLLVKDQRRTDEMGKLITAFLVMERQIRLHLQKSDETIQTQFHTLEAILRSMHEAVVLQNSAGEIVYANHVFSRAVGISQHELRASFVHASRLRKRLLTMLANPRLYSEVFEPAASGRDPASIEFQLRGIYRTQGQFIPVQRDIRVRLFHVRDTNGRLVGQGKIFQDITAERDAERIKRNLLAIVSHELRTPLTAIKGYATGLLDETENEIDLNWHRHSLGRIVDESNRLADLVTNLLDMSQVEAGTLKLYPELYLLNVLVEEAIALTFAPEDQHRVQVRLPAELPLLTVDRRRMVVVLRNILENARRYGEPDLLVEIGATCEEATTSPPPGLTMTIADNGPGIPPHLTDRIFDRFYRVEELDERNRNGVGLGLAICRGFVEAHQGRIWVSNRTDGTRGAVFHLWFPPALLRDRTPQPIDDD